MGLMSASSSSIAEGRVSLVFAQLLSLSFPPFTPLLLSMSLLRRALRTVGLRFGKDRYLAGTDLEGEFGLLDLEN